MITFLILTFVIGVIVFISLAIEFEFNEFVLGQLLGAIFALVLSIPVSIIAPDIGNIVPRTEIKELLDYIDGYVGLIENNVVLNYNGERVLFKNPFEFADVEAPTLQRTIFKKSKWAFWTEGKEHIKILLPYNSILKPVKQTYE